MKQVAVISGKGGTGKTSITAAFAGIQENLVLADCDVDAADLHLLVGADGKPEATEPFSSGYRAVVDPVQCDSCGKCVEVCRFGAVKLAGGQVTGNGKGGLILVDGSPGIGCPVIASVTGTDAALIVTEPSVSGLHDLERIADLCGHFHVPTCAVINKFDLSLELTEKVEDLCRHRGIAVLGRIPFDPHFIEAMVAGRTVLEYKGSPAAEAIREIWMAFAERSGIKENTSSKT